MVAPVVTASLISSGTKLLGGLFGSDGPSPVEQAAIQADWQHHMDRQKARTQPTYLREGAEKAGFNPLTVLRTMGGMSAAPVNVTAPVLSNDQFIAEAIGDMAATWFNRDAISEQAELDRVKVEMAKEELDYWKKRNAVKPVDKNFGFGLTGTTRTTTKQETVSPVLTGGGGGALPQRKVPVYQEPSTVMRDDGMTGANPDAPSEAEADLWQWARDGQIFQNTAEVFRRNVDQLPLLLGPFWKNVKKAPKQSTPQTRLPQLMAPGLAGPRP